MKVSINAGGREVEIECGDANVTYSDVADKALAVWRDTEGAKHGDGPAYGFAAERRGVQMSPMNMGGSHGRSGVVEPRAEAD